MGVWATLYPTDPRWGETLPPESIIPWGVGRWRQDPSYVSAGDRVQESQATLCQNTISELSGAMRNLPFSAWHPNSCFRLPCPSLPASMFVPHIAHLSFQRARAFTHLTCLLLLFCLPCQNVSTTMDLHARTCLGQRPWQALNKGMSLGVEGLSLQHNGRVLDQKVKELGLC